MYHKVDRYHQFNLDYPTKKTYTFLNYKKSETYQELKKSLSLNLLDKVVFLSVVLDFSFDYKNLVEFLCLYTCSNININNPKLIIFGYNLYNKISTLDKKFCSFNYQEFRNHLNLLVTTCCLSPKSPLPKLTTFKKNEDIGIHNYKHMITRKNFKHIDSIISINDNKIIFIPLNEIDYALGEGNNRHTLMIHAIHWLSLLFEWEKRSITPLCKTRKINGIDPKYNNLVVWLVWRIIFKNIENKELGVYPLINTLFHLYKSDFTKTNFNKRKIYLVYSFLIIINKTPSIDYQQSFNFYPKETLKINIKINMIYRNIFNMAENTQDKSTTKPDNKENKTKIFIPRITDN